MTDLRSATTYRLVRPSAQPRSRRPSTSSSSASSTTATVRCSCWPAPAPARPRRWSRRSSRRIEDGTHPDRILALTFSRKAAEQLRDRVAARVGRTMSASIGSTFHSFAYGLIRRYAPAELYVGPLRLLSAPEQDVVLRELLQDHPESVRWPDVAAARARHPRLRARGPRGPVPRPGEGARRRRAPAAGRGPTTCRSSWRPARSWSSTSTILDSRGAVDYADLIRRATIEATVAPRRAARRATPTSSSTSTRTPTPARSRCCGRSPATAATWSWSVTRTSRSTPSAAPRCAASSTSRPTSRTPTARPAEVVALGTTRRFGPRLLTAVQRVAGRIGLPGSIPESAREAFLAPTRRGGTARRGPGRRPHLRQRPGRGRAPRRPAPPRPPRGRHPVGRDGGAGALRPPVASRRCAVRSAPPACRSRWPATSCRWSATRPRCR